MVVWLALFILLNREISDSVPACPAVPGPPGYGFRYQASIPLPSSALASHNYSGPEGFWPREPSGRAPSGRCRARRRRRAEARRFQRGTGDGGRRVFRVLGGRAARARLPGLVARMVLAWPASLGDRFTAIGNVPDHGDRLRRILSAFGVPRPACR